MYLKKLDVSGTRKIFEIYYKTGTPRVRCDIEYEWVHRKVSNFGVAGKFLSLFAGGKLFVAVKVWYPMKEKVGSEFFVARKKFYSIYDTYALFSAPD